MWWRSLISLALLQLGACGFEPLYGASGSAAATSSRVIEAMAQTRVEPIADRIGQELRNDLLDRLTPRGAPGRPRYRLEVQLSERRDGLGIQRDDSVSFARVTLTAQFTLRDAGSGQTMTQGLSRWSNSFTVNRSQFATLSAEADARSRAAREIGDDIARQLAMFFSGRPG
jgi:LPS-assembly lipoprotein